MTTEAKTIQRLTKEQWRNLLQEQQDSSLSQSAFCRSKGLCLATFTNWKRRLKPHEPEQVSPPDWLELPVAEPSRTQAWDIELELPGNIILRMRQ